MGRISVLLLRCLLSLAIAMAAGEVGSTCRVSVRRSLSLKHYCDSWRINVELNNVQWFAAVPGECGAHVGNYMTSGQYEADVRRAVEEASLFLASGFSAGEGDGKDAWVFDIDDTLLSTLPYYKDHHFGAVLCCGGGNPDKTSLEGWKAEGEAPAIDGVLDLFLDIKARGIKIFIISYRGDQTRDITVDNLLKVGYSGWTGLILRCGDEEDVGVEAYKSEQRRKLVEQGYRILGIVSDQWSSMGCQPRAKRIFKLPNPMYYA